MDESKREKRLIVVREDSINRAALGLIETIFSHNSGNVKYRGGAVVINPDSTVIVAKESSALLGTLPDTEVVPVATSMLREVLAVLDAHYPVTDTNRQDWSAKHNN